MSYTVEQLALKAHIEAKNVETAQWVNAEEGRWAMSVTDNLDHWADYGIFNIAQYNHYMAAANHYDLYKEINGIRPRWMNYDEMSTEEIEADIDMLYAEAKDMQEDEEYYSCIDYEEEEAEAASMLTEDGPTKYEQMAEDAGYF